MASLYYRGDTIWMCFRDEAGKWRNKSTGYRKSNHGERRQAELRRDQQIYREAIGHIDDYLANVQRAKVNKAGTTSDGRTVDTNTKSNRPGSRGDLLSDPGKLKAQLEYVRGERKKTEELLQLETELQKERKLWWDGRMELPRKS